MTDEIHSYQKLAATVIVQAVTDLKHRDVRIRDGASHFLFGEDSECLQHWASQAGLEPTSVVQRLSDMTPARLSAALRAQRVTRRP